MDEEEERLVFPCPGDDNTQPAASITQKKSIIPPQIWPDRIDTHTPPFLRSGSQLIFIPLEKPC
jgi:hypothetical protein